MESNGHVRQQRSRVLRRQSVVKPQVNTTVPKTPTSTRAVLLTVMAVVVFVFGMLASWTTLKTSQQANEQVAALSKKAGEQTANSGAADLPSTNKPSDTAVRQYMVAPDMARYLNIPKLSVHARVMQAGVTSKGSLASPNNIYDADWYTGSAKPGQPGATLIDGHVASLKKPGIFYGLKSLVPGDQIQIIRGDNMVLTYKVIKSQTYSSSNVDMHAALTPITKGKSGLNLITCTGKVKANTHEFDQRLVVFAEQI